MDTNQHYENFIREELLKYDRFVSVSGNPDFNHHFDRWNFFDFDKILKIRMDQPGQIFLYEIYDGTSGTVSYPKIGIFLNYIPCDQTLEMEWMDWKRTWENNRKFRYNFRDGGYHDTEREYNFFNVGSSLRIRSMPEWSDYHLIYGVWDRLPDWKTLRRHYEQTWWFHRNLDEKRDISLERILGDIK